MSWEDPARDPIPPGHGEPRIHEEGKVYEIADVPLELETPFGTKMPVAKPPVMFGVPQCQRCWYFHTPEEGCNR